MKGMDICSFSVGKDMTRRDLTCAHVSGKSVKSSDDYRVSVQDISVDRRDRIKEPILVPGHLISDIVRMVPHKYTQDESWGYFINQEGIILAFRKVEGEVLDERNFFEFDTLASATLPAGLRSVVEDVSVLTKDQEEIDRKITLNIAKDEITCKGEKETAWFEKAVEIENDTLNIKPISIKINPMFLSQILGRTTTVEFGEDRVLFSSGSFKHLISAYSSEVQK